jgi:hypothetical protein
MNITSSGTRILRLFPRAAFALGAVLALGLICHDTVLAQRSYSRAYPANRNIRLRLNNWSGRIEVQGCDCKDIRVKIDVDTSSTRVKPELIDGVLVIDPGRDNPGVADVGAVNFTIRMPSTSAVDLETRVGDITVSDINGVSVRAHVTEGDINLLNINTGIIIAENQSGSILFDGEFQRGGQYKFKSVNGNITLRIPAYSAFHLEAAAPVSRSITMGSFASASLNSLGGGRKLIGTVGDGKATVNVMNLRGSISFLQR